MPGKKPSKLVARCIGIGLIVVAGVFLFTYSPPDPEPPAGGAVRVGNIHLPSSRQLGRQAAAEQRLRELQAVLDRDDPPAVLLGDFNEQPGGAVGDCLGRRGYLDAAVLTGWADRPSSLGGRGDQIWIRDSLRARVAEYGVMDRLSLTAGGREPLSDHFPVWIALAL